MSQLAVIWFPETEIALAITISSLSSPIGAITSSIIGPMIVPDYDKKSTHHIE